VSDERDRYVRTRLLRRVAHDIASPTGVVKTVLDEIAGGAAPRPELVAMAQRAVRRLGRIAQQLGVVAELETGPLEADRTAVDLGEVVRQAVEAAKALGARRGVTVDLEVAAPCVVEIDERLVAFAVQELVHNALRHARARVAVALSADAERARVRVDDDGPGFDGPPTLTRFTEHRGAGLGLSLSVIAEIAELHGGELTFEAPLGAAGTRAGAGVCLSVAIERPKVAR